MNAFFKAFMTILVPRVSSTSQPTIQRLCQSIMAVRYKKPRLIGIYVMSIDHAWFGIICHSANCFFTIFKIDGNIILLILVVNCNIKKYFFHIAIGSSTCRLLYVLFQIFPYLSPSRFCNLRISAISAGSHSTSLKEF